IASVDQGDAFKSSFRRWQIDGDFRLSLCELLAASDFDRLPVDRPPQPFSGALAHLAYFQERPRGFLGMFKNGARERMLGIPLQAGHEFEDIFLNEPRGKDEFSEPGCPVSERPGLIKNGHTASIDGLKDSRVLDDDATSCGE